MRSSAKLKEKFIQAVALDILSTHYQKYSYNKKIFAKTEVRTKARKRADGLIAWKHNQRKTNVASIEAKSANTLRNLLARPHEKKIRRSSQYLSFAILIGLTMLVFSLGYRLVLEPLMMIFSLLFSLALIWGIQKILQKAQFLHHQKIDVIEQIRQYPANERWIAIGFDSYTKESQLETLLQKCKANGFGLLIVQNTKNTKMELRPRFEPSPVGTDFLSFYQKESAIRESIAGNPAFGFTRRSPSHRAYFYRQNFLVFTYLSLLMFFSFLYIRPHIQDRPPPPLTSTPMLVAPSDTARPVPIAIDTENSKSTLPPSSMPEVETVITCPSKIKGTQYIVKVDLVKEEEKAREQVAQLERLNPDLLPAYFWLPCYETPLDQELFCVYVYSPRPEEAGAERNFNRIKYIWKQAKFDFERVEIWKIKHKTD